MSYPKYDCFEIHSSFTRIPNFFRACMFLSFSDFEPSTIVELFSTIKGVALPKNLMNILQSSLMFYYIIKVGKGLYLISIIEGESENSIITRVQKISCLNEA